MKEFWLGSSGRLVSGILVFAWLVFAAGGALLALQFYWLAGLFILVGCGIIAVVSLKEDKEDKEEKNDSESS